MSEDDDEDYEQTPIDVVMEQTRIYIQQLRGIIEHIKNAKEPEDRLGLASELSFSLNAMMISIKSWGSWLNNIADLSTMTKEELGPSYKAIKQMAIDFVKIDLDITEKKLMEAKIKLDKTAKKTRPRESAKKPYVT
jgi:hypothetical protein